MIWLSVWKSGTKDREYDRLGLNEEYTEFLGRLKSSAISIPIRPGRNLLIIVESAAVNIDRRRWATMRLRSCTAVYRRALTAIRNRESGGKEYAGNTVLELMWEVPR